VRAETLEFARDRHSRLRDPWRIQTIRGDRKEAEATFKKAIEVDPKSLDARIALANFYLAVADNMSAERTLQETLTIDANHTQANKLLAALYIRTGRSKDAEQPLVAATKATGDAASKLTLADYYLQMNRPADAKPILDSLVSDKRSYAGAALRLAGIERGSRRSDAAYRLVSEVLKAEPRNVLAWSVQSEWRLQDGNAKAALESAEAAVKIDAASARAQYALATAQIGLGNRRAAIDALNEVLRLSPKMLGAQVLMSRLQLATGECGRRRPIRDPRQVHPACQRRRTAGARQWTAGKRQRE
jgi:predicted Zn-dependent protease